MGCAGSKSTSKADLLVAMNACKKENDMLRGQIAENKVEADKYKVTIELLTAE